MADQGIWIRSPTIIHLSGPRLWLRDTSRYFRFYRRIRDGSNSTRDTYSSPPSIPPLKHPIKLLWPLKSSRTIPRKTSKNDQLRLSPGSFPATFAGEAHGSIPSILGTTKANLGNLGKPGETTGTCLMIPREIAGKRHEKTLDTWTWWGKHHRTIPRERLSSNYHL